MYLIENLQLWHDLFLELQRYIQGYDLKHKHQTDVQLCHGSKGLNTKTEMCINEPHVRKGMGGIGGRTTLTVMGNKRKWKDRSIYFGKSVANKPSYAANLIHEKRGGLWFIHLTKRWPGTWTWAQRVMRRAGMVGLWCVNRAWNWPLLLQTGLVSKFWNAVTLMKVLILSRGQTSTAVSKADLYVSTVP